MLLRPANSLPKTLESIQVLRAVAALLVTIFHLSIKMETVAIHSPILRCFKSGFGGVDLFFIISGYIITHTNLSKINHPDQLASYLKKRFGRIYSIYWLIVSLASIFLIWLHYVAPSLKWLPYSFDVIGILKALTLVPSHESTLPVTWTLSYEVYFYILFGLVIASRLLLIVPVVILTATLISGFSSLTGLPSLFDFRFNDFFFSPFNMEFCFGIGAYFITRRYRFKAPLILAGIAIIFFFVAGEFIDSSEIWLRIWGLGIPATVILMSLVSWELSYNLHYPAWLLKLGDASYILYLIHVPAIMVLTQALMLMNLSGFVLCANFLLIACMIWFSWQTHISIEKPLLRWINSEPIKVSDRKGWVIGAFRLRIVTSKPQPAHKLLAR
jgi:exopolysaccharide production protein ExoZ